MPWRWREKLAKLLGRPQPDDRRRLLIQEQLRLAETLERALKAYEVRLTEVAGKIHGLDDESLEREVGNLRLEQEALARAIQRLDFAEQSTFKLTDEWTEWQQAGERSSAKYADRLEMLRSELALRGVNLGEIETVEPENMMDEIEPFEVPVQPPRTDELSEWDELFGSSATEETAHWNRQLAEILDAEQIDPQRACEVARRLKHASGEERRARRC